MKRIALFVLIAATGTLTAADKPGTPTDPFAGAFFPPELVLMARERIALTQQQQETLRTRIEKTQARSEELRGNLERETAALTTLVKQQRVEEAALLAQLDKVLDVEREVKRLHVGTLAAIKNLLTPEQQATLREVAKGGAEQLGDDTRRRLTEKVQRVQETAQSWVSSGRDPSEFVHAMEEKFKPLMESGKIPEAEAELDRILGQLTKESK